MEAWGTFVLAVLVCIALLYIPGIVSFFRSCPTASSLLALSPLFSLTVYSVIGILFAFFDIAVSWVTFCFSGIVFSVITLTLLRLIPFGADRAVSYFDNKRDIAYCLLYSAIGIVISVLFFVKGLDGPESIVQSYDNSHQFALIQSFMNTGEFSTLGASLYDYNIDASVAPFGRSGFYPSAWHIVVSITALALGCSAAIASNALIFTLLAVIFPLSMLFFMQQILSNSERKNTVLIAGSCLSLACLSFPWVLIGPWALYPNFLSFSLLPCVLGILVRILHSLSELKIQIIDYLWLIIGMFALAVSQPNAIFAAGAVIAPLCVVSVFRLGMRKWQGKWALPLSFVLSIVALLCICLLWWICFNAPFLNSVVSYTWETNIPASQAILNILTLKLSSPFSEQYILGGLVFIGLMHCLVKANLRWFFASYLWLCFIYFVDVTSTGFLQHVLSGFWYTDPRRVAALIAILVIPLASIGFCAVFQLLWNSISHFTRNGISRMSNSLKHSSRYLGVASIVLCLSVIYLPCSFHDEPSSYGLMSEYFTSLNSSKENHVLTRSEADFIDEALSIVGEDSLILNVPADGSCYYYGTHGSNFYYRQIGGFDGESEAEISRLIRSSLCDLGSDETVRSAINAIGAKYILILDLGGCRGGGRMFPAAYSENQWIGFNQINDETPGVKVILSKHDMRLYEIEF